jgi:hypothetical protein
VVLNTHATLHQVVLVLQLRVSACVRQLLASAEDDAGDDDDDDDASEAADGEHRIFSGAVRRHALMRLRVSATLDISRA